MLRAYPQFQSGIYFSVMVFISLLKAEKDTSFTIEMNIPSHENSLALPNPTSQVTPFHQSSQLYRYGFLDLVVFDVLVS